MRFKAEDKPNSIGVMRASCTLRPALLHGHRKQTWKGARSTFCLGPWLLTSPGVLSSSWKEETRGESKGKQKHAWGGIQVLGDYQADNGWGVWEQWRGRRVDNQPRSPFNRKVPTAFLDHIVQSILHFPNSSSKSSYFKLSQCLVLLLATGCCILWHL